MTGNSLIKELSGENINTQTTIASLGLSVLVLAFSITGLAGFQPAEVSDSVLSVLSSKPKVLGVQDYPMQIVYSGNTLDLAVTPYDFDSNSGKWNYKISWNRKSGTVGNININGNLFYQGAESINEAYTGYNLSPASTYSISYSYSAKSGKKYITKVLTKRTFTTLKASETVNNVAEQPKNTTQAVNTTVDPLKTTVSMGKPTNWQVFDGSLYISSVIFSPKSDISGTGFYFLSHDTAKSVFSESKIPLTTITAGNQQATLERYIDTSNLPNGNYSLVIGVDLLDGSTIKTDIVKITIKHANSNALGVFKITAPAASSTWVGDAAIAITASGTSTSGFSGAYSIFIDGKPIASGVGQKSYDSKIITISTSISNIPSLYIFGLTEGPHSLAVKAFLVDGVNYLSDSEAIIYSKPTPTPLSPSATTVRVYSDDINEDGKVDYNDSSYLNSVIGGAFYCPLPNNCDVNGDGAINQSDALAYRKIMINRFDFDKDGNITFSDYVKMGDVVPGIIACPVTTCDFDGNGSVNNNDWTTLGTLLSTFPDIKIY